MSSDVQLKIQHDSNCQTKIIVDGHDIAGLCGGISLQLSAGDIPHATVDLTITRPVVVDLAKAKLCIGSLVIPFALEVELLWLLKKREAERRLD